MSASRELLFGLLALQNDFIDRAALVRAFDAWALDKTKSLADHLAEQKALTGEEQKLLEGLVDRFLVRHGGDPDRSLAALNSLGDLDYDLGQIDDPELQGTLAPVIAAEQTRRQARDAEAPFETTAAPVGPSPDGSRFQIVRPHAEGGLGQVFVARDLELNREVALKQIKEEHADNPDSRARFQLEAEITGRLEHPGIVPVYGLGTHGDGRPFYAMRFIRGQSLKEEIERFYGTGRRNGAPGDELPGERPASKTDARLEVGERAVEFRKLLQRFIDVCEAVHYAHSKGVLHRDLKPGNVMVGRYGETLVVDWGLAKVIGTESSPASAETVIVPASGSGGTPTMIGTAVGTPAFMSPEQAAGRLDTLGPASDVYSLGATLYMILTARAPFDSRHFKGGMGELLGHVQRGEFLRPREVNPQVPQALEAICLKAMAPKVELRYGTARELAAEIERFLADEPVLAFPESTADRLGRFGRKHRGYVRAAVISLAVVSLVSIAASLLINEQKRLAENSANEERKAKIKARELAESEGAARKDATESARQAELARQDAERDREEAIAQRRIANTEREKAEERELAARRNRYLSRMSLARLAWNRSDVTRVRELLDLERPGPGEPDMRTFIWHYLWRACRQDRLTLLGHEGPIWCLARSPDGRTIASGGEDGTVRLWDVTTGTEARILRADASSVNAVCFSRDGKFVAGGSNDRMVRVWSVADGILVAAFAGHQASVNAVAFSPDGRWIGSGGEDATVCIWDVEKRGMAATLKHSGKVSDLAFSPDGALIATASQNGTVQLWDVLEQKQRKAFSGHQGPVYSVTFTADGRRIVSGSQDSTIRIWDVQKEMELTSIATASPVRRAALSDGERTVIAAHRDGSATCWEIARQKQIWLLRGHAGVVEGVSQLEDGLLVTASRDETLKLWDLPKLDQLRLRDDGGSLYPVAFSPDGKWLASGAPGRRVRLWDLDSGRELRVLGNPVQGSNVMSIAFSPDGQTLAACSSDGQCAQWNVADWNERARHRAHSACIQRLTFSPDGALFATSGDDLVARVWRAKDNALLAAFGPHPHVVDVVAFMPGGDRVATAARNGTATIWDLAKGKEAARFHADGGMARSLAVSPDGKTLAVGTADARIRLWDVSSGEVRATLNGHLEQIESLAYAPDGSYLASGSNDGTVRVWDVDAAMEVEVLTGHNGQVDNIAISNDGLRIASVGPESVICVWPLARAIDEVASGIVRDPVEIDWLGNELIRWQKEGKRILKPGMRRFSASALAEWQKGAEERLTVFRPLATPRWHRVLDLAEQSLQRSQSVSQAVLADSTEFARLDEAVQWEHLPFRLQHVLNTRTDLGPVQAVLRHMESLARMEGGRLIDCASWSAFAGKRFAPSEGPSSADGPSPREWCLDNAMRLLQKARAAGIKPQLSWFKTVTGSPRLADLDVLAERDDLDTIVDGLNRSSIVKTWRLKYFAWPANGPMTPPADWNAMTRENPVATAESQSLSFSWGYDAPAKDVPSDHFALVATSEFDTEEADYIVEAGYDDGLRIYLDDALVLDRWGWHQYTTDRQRVHLSKGRHRLRVEYFEIDGAAALYVTCRQAPGLLGD